MHSDGEPILVPVPSAQKARALSLSSLAHHHGPLSLCSSSQFQGHYILKLLLPGSFLLEPNLNTQHSLPKALGQKHPQLSTGLCSRSPALPHFRLSAFINSAPTTPRHVYLAAGDPTAVLFSLAKCHLCFLKKYLKSGGNKKGLTVH